MNGGKKWWESKTIVASLAVVFLSMMATVGIDTVGLDPDGLAEKIVTITTAVGGIVAIIGRVQAKKEIK